MKPAAHKGEDIVLELARRMPEIEFLLIGGRPPGTLPMNVTVRDWTEPARALDGVTHLLVPSQWPEPFGRVVVEALGRGIPVLASRTGGLPEAGGRAARYVDEIASPEAWERAVRALLDDAGLEAEVRITGPAHAARFAPEKTVTPLVRSILADAPPVAAVPRALPAAPGRDAQPVVHWQGPFFESHSIAHVNREMAAALLDLGVAVHPMPASRALRRPEDPAGRRIVAACDSGAARSPDLTVRYAWPPSFHAPATGKLAVISAWEFGALPVSWMRAAERTVDEIWAVSDFVRATWLRAGFDPRRVVTLPHGVSTDLFRPGGPAPDPGTGRGFRFLWVGGGTARKGIDILLAAYGRAFRAEDDVCLVLKDAALYGEAVARAVAEFRRRAGAPEVVHRTDDITPAEMPALYRGCHAYVAPYRGEGYGLPIAEAMACGLPVLATGYGGALQFAGRDTAGLLPAPLRAAGLDRLDGYGLAGIPYLAEPSPVVVAEAMRALYENRDEARALGAAGAAAIRNGHTWKHAASRARDRIAALCEAAGERLERAS